MIWYVVLGLVVGVASGILGIGGGVLIVPALVYLFGLSQHNAQGTTLAIFTMPAGLFAAYAYSKAGFVDARIAVLIFTGFIFGGLIGARYAIMLPQELLQRVFGIMLIILGLKMLVFK